MCTCLCIVCYVSASYVHNDRLSRVVCVCIHIYIYIYSGSRMEHTRKEIGTRYRDGSLCGCARRGTSIMSLSFITGIPCDVRIK